MYSLKRDIAERIANKSFVLKQVLINGSVSSMNTHEYVVLNALKQFIVEDSETPLSASELEKKLKSEYVNHLVDSRDDADLLDYLIDLEREEALDETMTTDYTDEFFGFGGEIGL